MAYPQGARPLAPGQPIPALSARVAQPQQVVHYQAALRPGMPMQAPVMQPAAVMQPGQPVPVMQPGQPMTVRSVVMPAGGAQVSRPPYTGAAGAQPAYTQLPAGARVFRTSQGLTTSTRSVPVAAAQTRPNTLGGPAYSQGAYEVKHEKDEQLQNLKELRKTSSLKLVPVATGLQKFKQAAADSQLTRQQFLAAYASLMQENQLEMPSDEVKNAVFDLFDRDDNGIVDMMELICGISLLCQGSEDDKIHAVFNVFDENGDGFISMDEMYKFLTSVFKVVLTPVVIGAMNSMGVNVESAEDLASVTSLECFKTADLNHDGKLSVAEFKEWFYAPRNDPSFLFSPVRKLLQ